MSAKRIVILKPDPSTQYGAVMMIMLVLMLVGLAAIFFSSFNSSALQIARDQTTAEALSKAKEALIGRAVADLTSPGSLSCPDVDDDGIAESPVGQAGNNCPSYIGRLPYKTLGLPDLRDGSGERLWYALSSNFRDYVNPLTPATSNPINSNSLGNLTVSGTTSGNNVVAIIFAPGPPINGQSRSSTNPTTCSTSSSTVVENLCAANYLEGSNSAQNLPATPNQNYQSANSNPTFNDRLMLIATNDIISLVEMRVAKEVTKAFANYLSANGNQYPYPANFDSCTSTNCPSDTTVCVGKVPATDMNLQTTIPWFTNNNWFDVIYYAAGTSNLPSGGGGYGGGGYGGGGYGGGGYGGGGYGGGGYGGGGYGGGGSGLGCYTNLTVSGASANALILMPGMPLTGQTGRVSMSSSNLANYFEDVANQNNNGSYAQPSSSSNDSLYLP